jgi:hypothetical protein
MFEFDTLRIDGIGGCLDPVFAGFLQAGTRFPEVMTDQIHLKQFHKHIGIIQVPCFGCNSTVLIQIVNSIINTAFAGMNRKFRKRLFQFFGTFGNGMILFIQIGCFIDLQNVVGEFCGMPSGSASRDVKNCSTVSEGNF